MNIDRMLEVADHIENLDEEQFSMNHWRQRSSTCGTVCCIAGWAVELYDPECPLEAISPEARRLLSLPYNVSSALFNPPGPEEGGPGRVKTSGLIFEEVTTSEAASVIRGMVKLHMDGDPVSSLDVIDLWSQTEAWAREGERIGDTYPL